MSKCLGFEQENNLTDAQWNLVTKAWELLYRNLPNLIDIYYLAEKENHYYPDRDKDFILLTQSGEVGSTAHDFIKDDTLAFISAYNTRIEYFVLSKDKVKTGTCVKTRSEFYDSVAVVLFLLIDALDSTILTEWEDEVEECWEEVVKYTKDTLIAELKK